MSFLTINGIDVPVFHPGFSKSKDTVAGGTSRAQDGSLRATWTAKKWHCKGHTLELSQTDAIFLRALLDQLGDHWTFDTDAYSDKGAGYTGTGAPVPPAMPTGCTIIAAAPAPKRGAGCLQITNNAADFITFNAIDPLTDGWTIIVWVSTAAAAFHRWVITGTGTVAGGGAVGGAWLDGVAQASTMPAWCAVDAAANTVKLIGIAGSVQAFDDLVVIPAKASTSIATQLDTFFNAQAWPAPYPNLLCSGDFHPAALTMMGQPADGELAQMVLSGALTDTAERLTLELLEV